MKQALYLLVIVLFIVACSACQEHPGSKKHVIPHTLIRSIPSRLSSEEQCDHCKDGVVTAGCPDPGKCGFKPACKDCMDGMWMPDCPSPEMCKAEDRTGCVMLSVFGWSSNVCVVFEWWHVRTPGQWMASTIAMLVLCFLRELTTILRKQHARALRTRNDALRTEASQPMLGGRPRQLKAWRLQLVDSLWYLANLILSYFVMLAFMTYNGGVILTILLGCWLSHLGISLFLARRARKPGRTLASDAVPAEACCSSVDE